MTRPILAPEPFSAERAYLSRPMRTDPAGRTGPTPRAVRGRAYRRTSRGLYLPVAVSNALPEQRIVEAAEVLPSFGGVTGWGALRWSGARWFTGRTASQDPRPVALATGYADILPQPGILVSQERLGPGELTTLDGLRVTEAARSAYYEMRYAPDLRRAVEVADMAAYDDVVSLRELWDYALAHPGWTGAPQAREALALADENAWSPREVALRLWWRLDAGLPPPLTNRPIFDRRGSHICTPDLLDEEAGVAVEYNGVVHLDPRMRRADLGREDRCHAVGLELCVVVAGFSREQNAARMIAARRRARFATPSTRPWTVVPPPWWVSTASVEERRALDADQRTRILRYRNAVA